MGGPSKLQSAKSLEGTSLSNACSQKERKKKKKGIQKVYPTRHCYVLLLNVGLHAEIRVENDR